MDLEKLTKHQIVLLALLVAMVTSITTGIVSVSLMDQAPVSVTRTINQIVEHTVEKVVPTTQGAATITEKTVVVKDDDLAAQSIAAVQRSVIRIVAKGSDQLVTRGVIVSAKGVAVTDQSALEADPAKEFEAILSSDERVPLTIRKQVGTSTPLAVVDVAVGTSTGFAAANIVDLSKLKLGQTVIRIGGTGQDVVGSGIIAALPKKGSSLIESTVTSSTPGSVITTLFGEIIGIVTGDSAAIGSDFYTVVTSPAAPAPAPKTTST